jgi:hypothetical protein
MGHPGQSLNQLGLRSHFAAVEGKAGRLPFFFFFCCTSMSLLSKKSCLLQKEKKNTLTQ